MQKCVEVGMLCRTKINCSADLEERKELVERLASFLRDMKEASETPSILYTPRPPPMTTTITELSSPPVSLKWYPFPRFPPFLYSYPSSNSYTAPHANRNLNTKCNLDHDRRVPLLSVGWGNRVYAGCGLPRVDASPHWRDRLRLSGEPSLPPPFRPDWCSVIRQRGGEQRDS